MEPTLLHFDVTLCLVVCSMGVSREEWSEVRSIYGLLGAVFDDNWRVIGRSEQHLEIRSDNGLFFRCVRVVSVCLSVCLSVLFPGRGCRLRCVCP